MAQDEIQDFKFFNNMMATSFLKYRLSSTPPPAIANQFFLTVLPIQLNRRPIVVVTTHLGRRLIPFQFWAVEGNFGILVRIIRTGHRSGLLGPRALLLAMSKR